MPLVGLVALGLILYTLVAGIRLPRNIPGVLAAIVIGTALYYILGPHGWIGGTYQPLPAAELHLGFPVPTLLFLKGFVAGAEVPAARHTVRAPDRRGRHQRDRERARRRRRLQHPGHPAHRGGGDAGRRACAAASRSPRPTSASRRTRGWARAPATRSHRRVHRPGRDPRLRRVHRRADPARGAGADPHLRGARHHGAGVPGVPGPPRPRRGVLPTSRRSPGCSRSSTGRSSPPAPLPGCSPSPARSCPKCW